MLYLFLGLVPARKQKQITRAQNLDQSTKNGLLTVSCRMGKWRSKAVKVGVGVLKGGKMYFVRPLTAWMTFDTLHMR